LLGLGADFFRAAIFARIWKKFCWPPGFQIFFDLSTVSGLPYPKFERLFDAYPPWSNVRSNGPGSKLATLAPRRQRANATRQYAVNGRHTPR